MVLHLSKMACEIMIWYWQMSIPDFYLQKDAASDHPDYANFTISNIFSLL